jgi:hypothetical protein
MEEEIPLDDPPTDEAPAPTAKPVKKAPVYYEETEGYVPFDSGSPFVIESASLSADTQS